MVIPFRRLLTRLRLVSHPLASIGARGNVRRAIRVIRQGCAVSARKLYNILSKAKMPNCDCQPLEIPDDENIIRAIYYSVHVDKKGRLKWRAYVPTKNTDQISVMRSGCLSLSACKNRAKTMEQMPQKLYRGLAVLSTGAVRASGFSVSDSRIYFCGHGHISIGVKNIVPKNEEPADIEQTDRIREIAKKLIALSTYVEDPTPTSNDWAPEIALVPPAN